MSNEEQAAETQEQKPNGKPLFYIANVQEAFGSKKDIENHLMENQLAEDEVIIKGKCVETRPSVSIV